jgi:hypothetical protein
MARDQRPGIFLPFVDSIAFVDRLKVGLWEKEVPITDCLDKVRNVPTLFKGGFHSRRISGFWKNTGNPVDLLYGRVNRFDAVPDMLLTLDSEQIPLSAAQTELIIRELCPSCKRRQISSVEVACDLRGVTVCDFVRHGLHRARRRKFLEDLQGRKTYYVAARTSDWQIKAYTKAPDLTRFELTLRRGYLRRQEIRTPIEIFNLQSLLDPGKFISLCEISEPRLERAIRSWSPGAKAMARDYLAYRHPLSQFVQFLRANNIPPAAVLRPSEVHARVQEMIRRLYW